MTRLYQTLESRRELMGELIGAQVSPSITPLIAPLITPVINHSTRTREVVVSLSTALSLSDERRDYFTPQPTGFIYKCKDYKDLVKLWKSPPALAYDTYDNSHGSHGWNWATRHNASSYTPILYRSYNGDPYCRNNAWDLNRIMHTDQLNGIMHIESHIESHIELIKSLPTCPTIVSSDDASVMHLPLSPLFHTPLIDRIVESNNYVNHWSYSWMRPLERFFADVYTTDAIQAREDFEKKYAAVEINWTRF